MLIIMTLMVLCNSILAVVGEGVFGLFNKTGCNGGSERDTLEGLHTCMTGTYVYEECYVHTCMLKNCNNSTQKLLQNTSIHFSPFSLLFCGDGTLPPVTEAKLVSSVRMIQLGSSGIFFWPAACMRRTE